jgi:enoyl-CoA hydratase/carnithine racemase
LSLQHALPASRTRPWCAGLTHFCVLQLVAAVNGPAIGIGSTLIPHCDAAYCSTTTYFWTPFTRIAVVPEFCSSLLFPAVLGPSVATEMLLFGRKLSAEDAKRLGFVSDVLSPEQLLPHVSRDCLARCAELACLTRLTRHLWAAPRLCQVYKQLEAAFELPLSEKSMPLFKEMVKGPRRAQLLAVFHAEMKQLDERASNGDIMTAVAALLASKSKL